MSKLAFILRRARHYWQVLATLALGVILASGLLASGPTLVDTAIEFGLRRVLLTADPLDAHFRLVTRDEPEYLRFQVLQRETINLLTERFGSKVVAVIPAGNSRWFFPIFDGTVLEDERVNFRFYDTDTALLDERTEFLAGGWPTTVQRENIIAGVISETMAEAYELQVGDQLPLGLRTNATEPDFILEVSGIMRATDNRDLYWFGSFNPLRSQGG